MVETIRRFDIDLNSTQPQEATLVPEVGSEMYIAVSGEVWLICMYLTISLPTHRANKWSLNMHFSSPLQKLNVLMK